MKWEPRFTVLLDTNLLLLFIVGSVAAERIGAISRTDEFDQSDFEVLLAVLNDFRYTVTTPHVLSQTSDLLGKGVTGELEASLRRRLHQVAVVTHERFVTARKLGNDAFALPYGLADAGVIEAARSGCTVLSTDVALCNELQRRGLEAKNFNHLRYGQIT
jgi:hypothetical protein